MEVNVADAGKSSREISVELDAADVDRYFERVLGALGKTASVPGFRKGKVPGRILEARLGRGLRAEVLEVIIRDSYRSAREKEQFVPVSEARVSHGDAMPERGKPFGFKMTVEVKPGIEIGDYKGLVLEREKVEITEDMVEEAFKREQEGYARFNPVKDRPAGKGDLVSIEGSQSVGGNPAGEIPRTEVILGSGRLPEELERGLEGSLAGDEKEISVSGPGGRDVLYRLKVLEIKERRMIVVNDDFARAAGFSGTGEWREDLRKRLRESVEARVEHDLRRQAVEKLLESSSMELPEGPVQAHMDYLKKVYEALRREPGEDADEQRFRELAEKQVKENFVIEEIAGRESISVSDDEVAGESARISSSGRGEADEDELRYALKRRKVLDFIVSSAEVREKEKSVILKPDEVNLVSSGSGEGKGG